MPLDNHKGDTKWEYIFDSQGSSWYWFNWYTIKTVLVGNTNTNTGCEGGLVTLLEKRKKKKKIFTQLVAPYIKMNFHLELYSNIYMAPQKATLHSMVHWVNYVQMIAIIYPKNLFQLLRIPWSFILEWKIWIALVVIKDYSMNIQLVFLEVRWTLDLHRGKLVH